MLVLRGNVRRAHLAGDCLMIDQSVTHHATTWAFASHPSGAEQPGASGGWLCLIWRPAGLLYAASSAGLLWFGIGQMRLN